MTLYSSHWPVLFPDPLSQHQTRRGGGYPHTMVCFGFLGLASRAARLTALLQDSTCIVEEREGEGGGEEEKQNACESDKYGCIIAEDVVIGLHH